MKKKVVIEQENEKEKETAPVLTEHRPVDAPAVFDPELPENKQREFR